MWKHIIKPFADTQPKIHLCKSVFDKQPQWNGFILEFSQSKSLTRAAKLEEIIEVILI